MKKARMFLGLGILIGSMSLAHLAAQSVSISMSECVEAPNCNKCLYRIETVSKTVCASALICRAHLCDSFPLTMKRCIFKNDKTKTCDATRSTTGMCSDCNFRSCGCVAMGKCAGCACPDKTGSGMHTGYTTCP
jgi:hypothetical protein